MQISINTKEDTHEDIRKVIKMLQHLVGEHAATNQPANIFDDPNSFGGSSSERPDETAGSGGDIFGGVFGGIDTPPTGSETTETPEAEEEKDDEIPEIIPY